MKNFLSFAFVIAGGLFLHQVCPGQNKPDSSKIDDYYIDFSTPDIGAFTLLNIKPDNITAPGNTKEFAASILDVVSGGSKITPGLAVDWSPGRTFLKMYSPEDYRNQILWRNLQITTGTVADSSGTKCAVGIKWTPIDKTDPLLDKNYRNRLVYIDTNGSAALSRIKNTFLNDLSFFLDEIVRKYNLDNAQYLKLLEVMAVLNPADSTAESNPADENFSRVIQIINDCIKSKNVNNETDELIKQQVNTFCNRLNKIGTEDELFERRVAREFEKERTKWLNDHWNATVLTFGFGWTGNSPDNKWKSLSFEFLKAYVNMKFKTSRRSQVVWIISGTIPQNSNPVDSTIVDKLFGGGRFMVGNAKKRFSIDAGYGYNIAKKSGFDTQVVILNLGVEFKITEGVFLEIAGGFNGKPTDFFSNSNILALGGVKYAFHPKSRFELPE